MLRPLEGEEYYRGNERLEVAREWLMLYQRAITPTPFAVYPLYEALKAGATKEYIEEYFRRLPEYEKIERIFKKTLNLAELEFTTSSYYKPSTS